MPYQHGPFSQLRRQGGRIALRMPREHKVGL